MYRVTNNFGRRNMIESSKAPETFVVGEWAEYHEKGEYRRKVQITAVNGVEVTARVVGKPTIFIPRHSDGKYVIAGSPEHEEMPTMITYLPPAPKKEKTTWRDVRDFLHGMFWGSSL
jgi:hypothetical protein